MKNSLVKKIMTCIAIGALAISMVGCGKESGQATVSSIKENGKLVIGMSADYPPYEFHKDIDGKDEIIGMDISIAKDIAEDLGVELEIKDMDFEGLLVALQSHKIDMVISGMTPNDERKENADFSDIYYSAKHTFIMREGEETSVKSFDDLKGKKIGVQKGTIQETLAKENLPDNEIKALGKVTDLILDLKNNKVDAILVELPVAQFNCEKNTGIALTSFIVEDKDGGSAIAMNKGSDELVEQVNKTIAKLKDENKIEEYFNEANQLVE